MNAAGLFRPFRLFLLIEKRKPGPSTPAEDVPTMPGGPGPKEVLPILSVSKQLSASARVNFKEI